MRTQFSIVRAGSACPLFAKLAALVLAITFTFGCSSDGGNEPGGGTSSPNGNNNGGGSSSPSGGGGGIVNAANEAWIYKNNKEGLIFKQNGELIYVTNIDDDWYIDKHYQNYSISGSQIAFNGGSRGQFKNRSFNYSVSGNTFAIWGINDEQSTGLSYIRTGGLNIKDGSDYVEKGNNIANYRPPVPIGDQIWMAENLDYKVAGSKCYYDNDSFCTKFGRLYTWAAAMDIDTRYNNERWGESDVNHKGLCPNGWHIPTEEDLDKLVSHAENSKGCYSGSSCSQYLKATSGWFSSSGNKDSFGFSAMGGGRVDDDGSFEDIGETGYWWFASDNGTRAGGIAHSWDSENFGGGGWQDDTDKNEYHSIRCLKND